MNVAKRTYVENYAAQLQTAADQITPFRCSWRATPTSTKALADHDESQCLARFGCTYTY